MSSQTITAAALLGLIGCSRSPSQPATLDAAPGGPQKPAPSAVTATSAPRATSPAVARVSAPLPTGFARHAAFHVTKDPNGVDGAVELLVDERIRFSELPDGGVLGGDPCDPPLELPTPPFCKAVKKGLHHARLRLVTSEGRELSALKTERPLADVETVELHGSMKSFRVTVDLSAGFGSYSGPFTKFAEVRDGTLGWLTALDASTGKEVDISIMTSLKTGWKIDPVPGGGYEILEVACRPAFETEKPDADPGFSIHLTRFAIEAGKWRRHTRVENGFWEEEHEFPRRARFR